MSDKKRDAENTTLDNSMPSEPVKSATRTATTTDAATITTMDNSMPTPPKNPVLRPLDNSMPSEPVGTDAVTTMDNSMPAPPALDLDGKK